MTADRDRYSCPKCRAEFTPGRHIIDPAEGRDLSQLSSDELARLEPYEVPCPNKVATQEAGKQRDVAKIAQTDAWKAAQEIMRDVAETLSVFDANVIRDRFDDARIPTSLRGSAFTWAAKAGLIEPFDRTQSNQATTRHGIARWRSLAGGSRRAS